MLSLRCLWNKCQVEGSVDFELREPVRGRGWHFRVVTIKMVFKAMCENKYICLESTSFLPVLLKEVYFLLKSNPFSPYTVVLSTFKIFVLFTSPSMSLLSTRLFLTVCKHALYLQLYKKYSWIQFISLLPCTTKSLRVVSNFLSPIYSSSKFDLVSVSFL